MNKTAFKEKKPLFSIEEYLPYYDKIKDILDDDKCRVIVNANQKGGVGKTTNTAMEGYILANLFNQKVLFIDEDMQANLTSIISKTFNVNTFPKSLQAAIEEGDLSSAITKLSDNIDIIPGQFDSRDLVNFLVSSFPKDVTRQTYYLSNLIDKIKDNYDFIFIDVPPSADLKVDNAIVATDYLIVVQETQQFALEGSATFIDTYLKTLLDDFGDKFKTEIIGILPVLLQKKRKLHEKILEQTKEKYGVENVFNTTINNHARLELYGKLGIQFEDNWDRIMFALFADIVQELLERIVLFEKDDDLDNYSYTSIFYNSQAGKLTPIGKEFLINGQID